MGSELRQYTRHHIDIPITVSVLDQSSGHPLSMRIQFLNNISDGGLSFSSEELWEQNTPIKITFTAPYHCAREIMEVIGKVAWCAPSGNRYGILVPISWRCSVLIVSKLFRNMILIAHFPKF